MLDGATSLNDPKRLAARHKADEFLRSLVEGTITSTGGDFLRELVRTFAIASSVTCCPDPRSGPSHSGRAMGTWIPLNIRWRGRPART